MPITPYDSIFISSSVLLSLQLPAYHFTQTYGGPHLPLAQTTEKKKKLFLRIHQQLFIQKLFRTLI